MKINKLLLLSAVLFLACSCTAKNNTSSNTNNNDPGTSQPGGSGEGGSGGEGGGGQGGGGETGPTKVTVPAHTLSDTNPPVDVDADGTRVTKQVWDSYRNGTNTKISGLYNFTYFSYSNGIYSYEYFTKNGYCVQSTTGKLYYERISGNNFYSYASVKDGWLRSTTTLDLQSKLVYRINHEISVHMFEFENYEFIEEAGYYMYVTQTFGCTVEFKNGYLTGLRYEMGSAGIFNIKDAFSTTISIPASYYYQN